MRTVERRALRLTVGRASLAYVALPVALFLAGWLRPAWAVALVAAVGLGTVGWARRLRGAAGAPDDGRPVAVGALAGGVALVVAVVAMLGPGGFGIQTWDWAKHNAILRDLVEQPWPVVYAPGGDHASLTYYVAYYLPAAVVGKVAGWRAANVALFAWSAVGAALACLWLVVLSAAPVWRCVVLFLLFSGLDLVGAGTWSGRWSGTAWIHDFHVEWWANRWTFPGNVTLLAFAPHQALGAWLLTGLALDGLGRDPGRSPHVLGSALGLLWSPFATLGLLGFAALDWGTAWARRGGLRGLARDGAELAGALTGLVLAAYLASHWWPVALPARYYPPADRIAAAALTFLPARLGWRAFAADYAMFVLLEFLLLAVLLAAVHRGRRRELAVLGVASATLLLLPFLRYGYYNELAMRASIPALFALQVVAARALAPPLPRRSVAVAALAAVLLLGATYPANMLRLGVSAVAHRRALVRIPPRARVPDLFRQQLDLRNAYFHVGQYIGAADAPFFRVLARPARPVPKGSAGP